MSGKTVSFASQEKEGGTSRDRGKSHDEEAFTQEPPLPSLKFEEMAGITPQESELNVALTQAPPEPDLFEIFQEVKERGSIAHPHLVTVETDSKGKETLTPHHFF